MLRVIEFFAGIGCVHEGFRQSGLDFEIVARAEISPKKDRMYEELWGSDVQNLGDVTAINDLPNADFWHFSSPCQDLSISGRHAGIYAERSGLAWRMLELAKIHRPKFLMSENVLPFLRAATDSGYLAAFAALGYKIFWIKLSPHEIGIPQSRPRVFTFFRRDGGERPAPIALRPMVELYRFLWDLETPAPSKEFHLKGRGFLWPYCLDKEQHSIAWKKCACLMESERTYVFWPYTPRKRRYFERVELLKLQGFERWPLRSKISDAQWGAGVGDGLNAKCYALLLQSIFAPTNCAGKSWTRFEPKNQLTLF